MQVSIATRISPALAQWLDDYSKKTGIPKAQIIAAGLELYRQANDKEETK